MCGQKNYLSYRLKLEPITTYHLEVVVKLLYKRSTSQAIIILHQITSVWLKFLLQKQVCSHLG